MRSGFGKAAQKIRAKRGMTQSQFAEATGWSLSRISNIEFQRSAISDDVLRDYLRVLQPSGTEADQLRKLARFSNELRKEEKSNLDTPAMVALLRQFGDKLSPSARAEIEKIVERETGEQVAALTFASNQMPTKVQRKRTKRVTLEKQRFVEVCIAASKFRRQFSQETHKLDLQIVLDRLSANTDDFDYRISETLPVWAAGAFAVIVGHNAGVTLYLKEEGYLSSVRGVHFCRHVIAHEIAHYVLHRDNWNQMPKWHFSRRVLRGNLPSMIGSDRQIEQIVDSQEEAEAECFATFLLVPWEAILRGTTPQYLSSDFGEQRGEIDRYMRYFAQNSVVTEFKRQLWAAGEKSHPIFHS